MGVSDVDCLTICATVIISRAAEDCSASKEPKSSFSGSSASNAALIPASMARRAGHFVLCRLLQTGSLPQRVVQLRGVQPELSCASERPCRASPARAMQSIIRASPSAASMAAGRARQSPVRHW